MVYDLRISDLNSDFVSSNLLRIPCCWTAFLSVLFQMLKREPLNIAEDHTYFFRAVADRELRLAHARFLLSNEIAQADIRIARKAAAIAAVALPITIPVVADINRVIARLRHRDRKSTRLNSSH